MERNLGDRSMVLGQRVERSWMVEGIGSLKCRTFKWDVVGHVSNPNIQEAEAGGLP